MTTFCKCGAACRRCASQGERLSGKGIPSHPLFDDDSVYLIEGHVANKLWRAAEILQAGSGDERDLGHKIWLAVNAVHKIGPCS